MERFPILLRLGHGYEHTYEFSQDDFEFTR